VCYAGAAAPRTASTQPPRRCPARKCMRSIPGPAPPHAGVPHTRARAHTHTHTTAIYARANRLPRALLAPGSIPMKRVTFEANQDYQYVDNFKMLQSSFKKKGVDKASPHPTRGASAPALPHPPPPTPALPEPPTQPPLPSPPLWQSFFSLADLSCARGTPAGHPGRAADQGAVPGQL